MPGTGGVDPHRGRDRGPVQPVRRLRHCHGHGHHGQGLSLRPNLPPPGRGAAQRLLGDQPAVFSPIPRGVVMKSPDRGLHRQRFIVYAPGADPLSGFCVD